MARQDELAYQQTPEGRARTKIAVGQWKGLSSEEKLGLKKAMPAVLEIKNLGPRSVADIISAIYNKPDVVVLSVLYKNPPLRVREIADMTGLTYELVKDAFDILERKGYLIGQIDHESGFKYYLFKAKGRRIAPREE